MTWNVLARDGIEPPKPALFTNGFCVYSFSKTSASHTTPRQRMVSWYRHLDLMMDYSEIITIEPGKMGGKPCIRGLRITVYDVLDYLASGMTEDEILRDFPDLAKADLRACLAFAADRERKLASLPA